MVLSYFPYKVGGALAWNDPSYIQRQADLDLLQAIERGKFAYVLGSRQLGKSSLRIQARHQLTQKGHQCATIQATQLIAQRQSDSVKDLLCMLHIELISDNLQPLLQWLQSVSELSPVDCLIRFVDDFLAEILSRRSAVVFIDEIDALLETPLSSVLFSWMAKCYDSRATNPMYQQLNFVVLGTAILSDLPQVGSLFSQGCNISLSPFKLFETYNFQAGFEEKLEAPTTLLQAVYRWTHGQPFLTQKLCHIISTLIDNLVQPSSNPIQLSAKTLNQWVDDIVRSHIIQDWQTKDEPIHLRAIGHRINRSFNKKALLSLYHNLLLDKPIEANNSYTQAELLLSGLAITEDGYLQIANEIYRAIFKVK
ncbi:MAG: AAA-like domain-containing protein [Cyanobacteria bacterium J06650_10]